LRVFCPLLLLPCEATRWLERLATAFAWKCCVLCAVPNFMCSLLLQTKVADKKK